MNHHQDSIPDNRRSKAIRDLLKPIRLQYGIVTNDDDNTANDSLIEDIRLIDLDSDDHAVTNNEQHQQHLCQCTAVVNNRQTSDFIPKKLLDHIRRQDEKLAAISEKIEQLLRLHQNDENVQMESIPCLPNASKSKNYLDSSIELVRHNLRRNFAKDKHTRPKEPVPDDLNTSTSSGSSSNDDRYYSLMLSRMVGESPSDSPGASSSTSTTTSEDDADRSRSSCSIGRHEDRFRQSKQKKTYRRTEQSIYIERLASKYGDGEKNSPTRPTGDMWMVGSLAAHIKTTRTTRTKKRIGEQKTTRTRGEMFERYALSDLNSSIATKHYLDKYGLTFDDDDRHPTEPKSLFGS